MNDSFYTVIFYAAIGIAVFLILRWFSKRGEWLISQRKRWIDELPNAKARILNVGRSETRKHKSRIILQLNLEIYPLDFRPSFQTSTVWEIEPARITELLPEKMLQVKFDEHRRSNIYPAVNWAEFSENYCRNWNYTQ